MKFEPGTRVKVKSELSHFFGWTGQVQTSYSTGHFIGAETHVHVQMDEFCGADSDGMLRVLMPPLFFNEKELELSD